MIDETDLLVSNSYISLCSLTMAHKVSRWPQTETEKAINQNDGNWLYSSFKNKTRENLKKYGFFEVKYYNPKEMIFQHMSAKGNVFDNRIIIYEEIERFRNGDITQHLTSVVIGEIVRSGGYIVNILEGIICVDLEHNLFQRFITDMTEKRKKTEKEIKTFLQTITKKCSNSVYGGCRRKDIEDFEECGTPRWMKNEYDDSVNHWFLLKNHNNRVRSKDSDGVDDAGLSRKKYFTAITSGMVHITAFERMKKRRYIGIRLA